MYVYDLKKLKNKLENPTYTAQKVSWSAIIDLDVSGNKVVRAGSDGTAYDIYYYVRS